MRKKQYTLEQVKLLESNPNVVMVKYGRQIEYKESFKKWAVIQSLNHPELSASQIFELAGFDKNIIGPYIPTSRINDWKGLYFRYKTMIYSPKNISNEKIDIQNNKLLMLLLSRFDQLISIIGKKY